MGWTWLSGNGSSGSVGMRLPLLPPVWRAYTSRSICPTSRWLRCAGRPPLMAQAPTATSVLQCARKSRSTSTFSALHKPPSINPISQRQVRNCVHAAPSSTCCETGLVSNRRWPIGTTNPLRLCKMTPTGHILAARSLPLMPLSSSMPLGLLTNKRV